MNNGVDLHLHSTASDGRYAPSQLVQLALRKELRAIALTDHDTTGGIEEALSAAQQTGLTVIPGVEISTNVSGDLELHILGYHIDHRHGPLQKRLQELRESRLVRAREILRLLEKTGLPLPWERVLAMAGHGSIGSASHRPGDGRGQLRDLGRKRVPSLHRQRRTRLCRALQTCS